MGQARYHWAIRRVVSKEESVRLSLERNKLKVVLLEGIHPSAVEAFTADGYTQIETHPKALEGQALIDAIADAHFVGLRSRTQLTAEVLEQAQKLVAVGAFCIGTNQIALDAAARRGVPVFNAPFSNTRSVAELVLAEIIMLMRGIPQKNALLHRGGWMKSAANSFEVRGKTLGIIGYGHIGTQLGLLAETLGMRVVFYDIETKLPLGNARQLSTLDELLAEADVVSLHVPETPDTKNMMGAEQIARMKKGSFLINASRGTVVDIDALAAALESKHILGAAIDVFPVEPKGNEGDFHRWGPGEHRTRGGFQAHPLQQQRLHAVGGQLPRGLAAGSPGAVPDPAHPPQRAGHADPHQRAALQRRHQHCLAVPADQSARGLRGG